MKRIMASFLVILATLGLMNNVVSAATALNVAKPQVTSPTLPPLAVPAEPAEGEAPVDPEHDPCDGEVCTQGTKTAIVKAAIRATVKVLRDNVDDVLRAAEKYVPSKTYVNVLRNKAPRIATFLETLLEWEDLAWQTIYDQLYNFLRGTLGLAHLTSHWVALVMKWIIEWGVF